MLIEELKPGDKFTFLEDWDGEPCIMLFVSTDCCWWKLLNNVMPFRLRQVLGAATGGHLAYSAVLGANPVRKL